MLIRDPPTGGANDANRLPAADRRICDYNNSYYKVSIVLFVVKADRGLRC